MNNQNDYSPQVQDDQEQAAAIISFIVLVTIIGAAIAMLVAIQQRNRKPKTLREKLEHNLKHSGEATNQAIKQLSKDIDELRRSVEDRIGSRR